MLDLHGNVQIYVKVSVCDLYLSLCVTVSWGHPNVNLCTQTSTMAFLEAMLISSFKLCKTVVSIEVYNTIQCNVTLLPSVNTLIARGMFCTLITHSLQS